MNKAALSNIIVKKIFSANIFFGAVGASFCENRRNWSLILKYEGQTEYNSGGKKIISNIDNIVLLPMGSKYDWSCVRAGNFFVVEFDADLELDCIISIPLKNPETFIKRFSELVNAWTVKDPLYKLETMKLLYDILLKLGTSNRVYTPTAKQERLRPALEYIAQNYAQDIGNDQLAALVSMSTVYFRKLFADTMNISPIRYLHRYRIGKAKEMLKGDYTSISDIAETLGYSSIYYFSKVFKHYTGMSPAQYAKKQ